MKEEQIENLFPAFLLFFEMLFICTFNVLLDLEFRYAQTIQKYNDIELILILHNIDLATSCSLKLVTF